MLSIAGRSFALFSRFLQGNRMGVYGLSYSHVKPFDPSEYSGLASSGQGNNRGPLSGPRGSRQLQLKHNANLMPGRPSRRLGTASAGTDINCIFAAGIDPFSRENLTCQFW
jgi:hypothetical protein